MVVVDSRLITDALAISDHWRERLDVGRLTLDCLVASDLVGSRLDVVAIGKASWEMAAALHSVAGEHVARTLIVAEHAGGSEADFAAEVVVGEHPRPGRGSRRAGEAVVDFLGVGTAAEATVFLLSGGASSLCVLPAAPVTVADLGAIFDAALVSGVDITTLNQLRAAASEIAGGAVLHSVRSARSASFILVDNVVSGAPWVASALTYDYVPSSQELATLLDAAGLAGTPVGGRLLEGFQRRREVMAKPTSSAHQNVVLAEPSMILDPTLAEAVRRGYRVVNLGASVKGDVRDVCEQWRAVLWDAATPGDAVAVVGVGEVTVQVRGSGRGGRCQEFAWAMAPALGGLGRDAAFLARASDGRDFIDGVAGGWVDDATMSRLAAHSVSWSEVVTAHDTYPALDSLGQLISGSHTGWNLCDVYVAVMGEALFEGGRGVGAT